jgi:sugar O-acyltransferase (sialic acid O-acetyltransferase NeuD family)
MIRYIFGAGAHGRVVADILHSQNSSVDGFLDDDVTLQGTCVAGYPVIGGSEILLASSKNDTVQIIVALGIAPLRLKLSKQFRLLGCDLINAIHKSAVVSSSAILGRGICVCANAVINPDARVGDAVIINTGATVDHDCKIADGAHLSPGVHLAGRVMVGSLCFIGTGASAAPRVQMGANSIIGAGSVVVKDIPAGVLAYGVPARVIRRLERTVEWGRLL